MATHQANIINFADRSALRPDLVERLLRPKSVAILGVSARAGSPGRAVAGLLDQNGFAGEVHLVGRNGGEADGRAILADPADLPQGIDLAVLTLPAAAVPDAIEACIERQVGAAVVFASGFAEAGEESRGAQEALSRRVQEAGLGVAGPNCLGFTNYIDRVDIGFVPVPPIKALSAQPAIAIVAQSGGLMGHACWALEARNLPIAYRLSTGNEAGLGLPDYIAFMADDPAVGVIAVYAEQIRKPAAFIEAAKRARQAGKSIILYHTGRGTKAKQAAASHTGAMAGDYATMAVLCSHAGVLVTDTLEEWIDCTEMLARYPEAPVLDPAVMTTSGAFCAIAHDCFEELGIALPALSPESEAALRPRLPEFTPPKNPLDLTTQVISDIPLTADALRVLIGDPTIGSIAVAVPALGPDAVRWLAPFVDVVAGSAKPVLLTALGEDAPIAADFEKLARESGLLLSRSPERALRTIAAVTHHGRALSRKVPELGPLPPGASAPLRPGVEPEWLSKDILKAIGIDRPAGGLAGNADEASAIAQSIGYPVVLKVQASELAHKTEVGGVKLNLNDEGAVRAAHEELQARVEQARPGTRLDGMLVEKMAPKGLELVVGAKRDEQWGPVLLVGLGGVMVEALQDVRLLPPDLALTDIVSELRKLKAARLLDAFRGAPARDVAAVAHVVSRIGQLMLERPEIAEIDINPLLVFAEGEGALALDALIVSDQLDA